MTLEGWLVMTQNKMTPLFWAMTNHFSRSEGYSRHSFVCVGASYFSQVNLDYRFPFGQRTPLFGGKQVSGVSGGSKYPFARLAKGIGSILLCLLGWMIIFYAPYAPGT